MLDLPPKSTAAWAAAGDSLVETKYLASNSLDGSKIII